MLKNYNNNTVQIYLEVESREVTENKGREISNDMHSSNKVL